MGAKQTGEGRAGGVITGEVTKGMEEEESLEVGEQVVAVEGGESGGMGEGVTRCEGEEGEVGSTEEVEARLGSDEVGLAWRPGGIVSAGIKMGLRTGEEVAGEWLGAGILAGNVDSSKTTWRVMNTLLEMGSRHRYPL